MSAVIKLKKIGTKKKPTARICVFDSRSATKARVIDHLGFYYPCKNPPEISIDMEKAKAWIKKGAVPSEAVMSILKKAQVIK